MKLTATNKKLEEIGKKYTRLELVSGKNKPTALLIGANAISVLQFSAANIKKMDERKFRTTLRSIVLAAKTHKIKRLALGISPGDFPSLKEYGERWFWQTVAENFLLAEYSFTKYKSNNENTNVREILLSGVEDKSAKKALLKGETVAKAMNLTRDIANTPALDMTPSILATLTKKTFSNSRVKVEVLGEDKLRKLNAGLILAVGQGTTEESKLIVMTYNGGKKNTRPLVLIGKGITYDTGGLNVKPTGAMHDMHMDMSGGAAVLGAMKAISDLKLEKNVIGIIPAAENAVSDSSMRAGDIVTSMSGKTVEILHTDAEGRLVLADALTYSGKFKPHTIIDVATLTGASLVALGQHASAIMTKNNDLEAKLRTLGEKTGDLVWPLPLWNEYKQYLKSARADISNIATNFSRFGGTIEGGVFLSHFVPKGVKWAHIDMAPRMDSVASDKLAKGATGEPVRLLVKIAEEI
tara:strand:- start:665 stop:2065 length:1401 start_codon:yes stop_codon:yes gene_type:complete